MTEAQIVEIMARAFSGAPFPSTRSIARARDALAALRSAGLTVLPESQWQPIETAPKDGARVLLWDRHVGAVVSYWLSGPSLDCWNRIDTHPTHWQPLPQPPASR